MSEELSQMEYNKLYNRIERQAVKKNLMFKEVGLYAREEKTIEAMVDLNDLFEEFVISLEEWKDEYEYLGTFDSVVRDKTVCQIAEYLQENWR